MKEEQPPISRREFLKSTAVTAGGAVLAVINRNDVLAAAGNADVVLYNGKIATMDAKNTIVQALAISGGKVLKTGTDQVVKALAGSKTRMINLQGRTATPGFVDAHNHMSPFGMVGTAYLDINPPAVTTAAQMQQVIKDGCDRTPDGKWVIAQGYIGFEGETPDKAILDPVSPNHPVMLINQGGHMGAVNSAALKLANVTAATKDPPYGMLVRDSNGDPTGSLVNHSAMDIFRKLWAAEVVTPEVRRQSILKPQADYVSYGITTVGDVNVRGMDYVKSYFDIAKNHANTVRTYILNTIEYFPELSGRPEEVKDALYEDDGMHFGGYKFLVDGATAAAYMHEPTTGIVWNLATWNANDLKGAASTIHDLGYQCSFHCIGDAAVDMALDAIEYAMNRNPRPDPRHRIEHAVLSTQSALERTRDLGVTISTQPHGIYYLADWFRENWGEERTNRIVPTRTTWRWAYLFQSVLTARPCCGGSQRPSWYLPSPA